MKDLKLLQIIGKGEFGGESGTEGVPLVSLAETSDLKDLFNAG